uniref:Diacylglycerol kinase n=1 Tax=Timspurckia oligopyrenoides TaxID=708627 RepID=A0A7S0ZH04_9RHOD|mmetsp:Transcript_4962/g.8624  ORF Transcript_4962/g.8624 Transcript_4962/m.8624 type:complete len:387 (+) Transcript_4962:64-1224(+)
MAPTIVMFVNRKSGGQKGVRIYEEFHSLIGDRCVYLDDGASLGIQQCVQVLEQSEEYKKLIESVDLSDPDHKFVSTENILRCVCSGGDGTVSWVLGEMDKSELIPKFVRIPVAHLPLGTGNDFARATGWGGGYDGGSPKQILQKVQNASAVRLDRWKLSVKTLSDGVSKEFPFHNYISIGCDAAVAYGFDDLRRRKPHLFTSRARNKLIYIGQGALVTFTGKGGLIRKKVQVSGESVQKTMEEDKIHTHEFELPMLAQSLVIENVPSYMGGADIWGKKGESVVCLPMIHTDPTKGRHAPPGGFQEQSLGDGVLEALTFQGPAQQGIASVVKSTARRVGQASKFHIECRHSRWYVQYDGEPLLFEDEKGIDVDVWLGRSASVLVNKS